MKNLPHDPSAKRNAKRGQGQYIDLLEKFKSAPPPLDFIFPGFLAGTVGALVAPGATGKSFVTLEAAMAIACDVGGGDLMGLKPKKHGKVLFLMGENNEAVVHARLYDIGKYLKPAERQSIAKNLFIQILVGQKKDILDEDYRNEVIQQAQGMRLVILDTISRFHTTDENSNSHMAVLISHLEVIVTKTGAAVLFLHHVNKNSAMNGGGDLQQAARGASALTDNARWSGYCASMTEKEGESWALPEKPNVPIGREESKFFVRFGSSKQNHGKIESGIWLKREQGGVLTRAPLIPIAAQKAKSSRARV